MHIQQLITPQRVMPSVASAGKKNLFETLSTLLGKNEPDVDVQIAFRSLIEREQLGSTGIGEGVALPHGRVQGLKKAVGAFVTLEHEMDYEALDRKPVRMAFALLVPEHANDEHLKMLRELAMVFSQKSVREHLLHAKTADDLYRILNESTPAR